MCRPMESVCLSVAPPGRFLTEQLMVMFTVQAVSAPEETPAESAPEKPSDAGEDSVCEDSADAGGRGGSGGRKEAASNKTVTDGKLVKGTLLPAMTLRGFLHNREKGASDCRAGEWPLVLGGHSSFRLPTVPPHLGPWGHELM